MEAKQIKLSICAELLLFFSKIPKGSASDLPRGTIQIKKVQRLAERIHKKILLGKSPEETIQLVLWLKELFSLQNNDNLLSCKTYEPLSIARSLCKKLEKEGKKQTLCRELDNAASLERIKTLLIKLNLPALGVFLAQYFNLVQMALLPDLIAKIILVCLLFFTALAHLVTEFHTVSFSTKKVKELEEKVVEVVEVIEKSSSL